MGKRQDRRRCIFCGRAKGDLVDSNDPTSRKVIMTREHIFRESWQGKLVTSYVPRSHPAARREYVQYGFDGSKRLSRPDPLFEMVVKPVCDYCNNGWMNDLDTAVEPWILNPYSDEFECDPAQFRRWAIKVAVLRSHYESGVVPQPGDMGALYNGNDIPDWRIFVGHMALPNHSHTFVGFGPIVPTGGRIMGITQVSWSLGRVVVFALRLIGDDGTAINFFDMFKHSNRFRVLREALPDTTKLPSVELLPKLTTNQYNAWAWYFSTNPLSPISQGIQRFENEVRKAAKDSGSPFYEDVKELPKTAGISKNNLPQA